MKESLKIPKCDGDERPQIEEGWSIQWPTEKRTNNDLIYKTPHNKLLILMQCVIYLLIYYNESIGQSAVGFCWGIIMINLSHEI